MQTGGRKLFSAFAFTCDYLSHADHSFLVEFQLLHNAAAFHAERLSWRAVIYLNLVRSIRRLVVQISFGLLALYTWTNPLSYRILDAIAPETDVMDDHEDLMESGSLEPASIIISAKNRPASALSGTRVTRYDSYKRRLQPLEGLEERLIRTLSAPDEDEATHLDPSHWEPMSPGGTVGSPRWFPAPRPMNGRASMQDLNPKSSSSRKGKAKEKDKEPALHISTNWKRHFALGNNSSSPKYANTNEIAGWWEDPDDPVHVLNACAPAMQELWRDPAVRQRLKERRLRLEESSGL